MKKLTLALVAVLLVAGLIAATSPWRIPRAVVAQALEAGLPRSSGLHASLAGPATFKLLPRPRVQATQLTVGDHGGAVMLDAPLLKADLDIPSLARGVWRLTSATLVGPTATLDLDHMVAPILTEQGEHPSLQIRLRSGVLRLRSTSGPGDLLATGLDASMTWPGDSEAVVLSGMATVKGATARFAGALQNPALSMTPEGSNATLQVDSPLFSLAVDGILSGGPQQTFSGRASLSTSALPKLLRHLDGIPLAVAAKRAQISGDLVAKLHDLSLSNAQVRLDRARFEGTLAWRRDAGRSLVVGTLATDLLDLDALFGDGADRRAFEDLYRRPLVASPFGTDIDMRISATTARLQRVTVEDAAIAALVRGDRLELILDEARAYRGLVKARLLANIGADGIDAHAELSAKSVDLGALSEGLSGHERVGGALTGQTELDGRGASLLDVVSKLEGSGQIGIEGGRLAGLSLAQALRHLGRRIPLVADSRGTPTTFDKALWAVSIKNGVVRIPDGKLTAPGVSMSFGAETNLPAGRIDVQAVAAQTDRGGAKLPDGQSLPFEMRGTWAGPMVLEAKGAGLPLTTFPLFDGFAAQR